MLGFRIIASRNHPLDVKLVENPPQDFLCYLPV